MFRGSEGYYAVLLVAFAYNMASSMAVNSLTLRLVEKGFTPLEISYVTFTLNLMFIAFSSFAGKIGDVLGNRKPPVALGLLLLVSATLMLITGLDLLPLTVAIAAAVVAGVAGAFVSSNITMLAIEAGAPTAKRPEKALARLGFASGGGWATGLLVGSVVSNMYGTYANFYVSLVVAALALPALIFGIEKPLLPLERLHGVKLATPFYGFVDRVKMVYALLVEPPRLVSRVRRGLEDPLIALYISVLTGFTGIGMFFTQIPVYMKALGLSDDVVLAFLSVHSLTSTLSFTLIHRIVEKMKPDKSFMIALAARAIAFTLPPTIVAVMGSSMLPALFVLTGFTWSMLSVSMNSLVVLLSEEERKGERMGQLTAVMSLGLLIGSILSGAIVNAFGFSGNFLVAGLFEATAVALALLRLRGVAK